MDTALEAIALPDQGVIVHVGHRVYDDSFQPIVKTSFCFPLKTAPDVKVQEWSHIDGNLIEKIFILSWPLIGS